MTKILELRKKAGEINARLQSHASAFNERRKAGQAAWPDNTEAEWKAVNSEYDAVAAQIEEEERADQITERANKIKEAIGKSTRNGKQMPGLDDTLPGDERTYGDVGFDDVNLARAYAKRQHEKRLAFHAFLATRDNVPLTDEMQSACVSLRFNPEAKAVRGQLLQNSDHRQLQKQFRSRNGIQRELSSGPDERALSRVTANAGPELLPMSFVTQIEWAILTYGQFLSEVTTNTTATGEDMPMPYGDDTANTGAWVGAEGTDITGQGMPDPVFIRQTWSAHEVTSKFIMVPKSFSVDAFVDTEAMLAMLIGERIGRIANAGCTTGDASAKPTGILHASLGATAGATSALAAAIGYADIVKLEHSVDPALRSQSQFMFHDNILQALRLLVDSTGRPLWVSSLADGIPDSFNKKRYVINQDMNGTIATTNTTMLFGKLSDYILRRVGTIEVMKLTERFAEKLQDGYLGYTRMDGKLRRPTAAARVTVKRLVQA